ncbi:hypothetical protein ASD69_05755 [Lysobacter sp. Root604]|nr:hypothetical protein ASD69_05755 [Lysobacter sp. Root604]
MLFCDWRDVANGPEAGLHLYMTCLQAVGTGANTQQVYLRNAILEATYSEIALAVEPFIDESFS